jgi:methyl-accepting chemotaxis protein
MERTASPSRFLGVKIIKTGFQFKFSFIVFMFLALSAGSIWFWGNATVNRMIDSGMVRGDDAIASMQVLKDNIAYISILALAITFGLSLFFSHYIAGPIYRFEKTLESMRDAGDLTMYVKLRKRDEFKDTADLFNQALVSLRNKVKKEREGVQAHAEKIAQLATQLRAAGHEQNAAELERLVADLKNNPPQIKI